jgi:nucleotide-binding universal stress UspA family protein
MAVAAGSGELGENAIREDLMTVSIVCGVDDSASAKGASRVARELSARLGLRLVFVHVVDEGPAEDEGDAMAARLARLDGDAVEVDRGVRWRVEVGHPADGLVAAAQEEQAALIVVGSTGPRSSLLGSVSADVSRRAPCPVVVVSPGADRALPHGHEQRAEGRAFPGLADDGYAGVSAAAGAAMRERATDGRPAESQLVGGIFRFGLGGTSS